MHVHTFVYTYMCTYLSDFETGPLRGSLDCHGTHNPHDPPFLLLGLLSHCTHLCTDTSDGLLMCRHENSFVKYFFLSSTYVIVCITIPVYKLWGSLICISIGYMKLLSNNVNIIKLLSNSMSNCNKIFPSGHPVGILSQESLKSQVFPQFGAEIRKIERYGGIWPVSLGLMI